MRQRQQFLWQNRRKLVKSAYFSFQAFVKEIVLVYLILQLFLLEMLLIIGSSFIQNTVFCVVARFRLLGRYP